MAVRVPRRLLSSPFHSRPLPLLHHRFSTGSGKKVYLGAIDQGTSSTRFIVFDGELNPVASHQIPVKQSFPHPGWADMDANEIFASVNICAEAALEEAGIKGSDLAAVGVTNQRETTIVWDKNTGEPLAPAMLWFDDRTKPLCNKLTEDLGGDPQCLQKESGLRINPYFSAFKLRWLMENNSKVKQAIESGAAAFGTVESFLVWKLTEGDKYITDCTNASRTMLMDLNSLEWSENLCQTLGIPMNKGLLPEKILANAHPDAYGVVNVKGPLNGVRICGSIGDQQSALVGQGCFQKGQLKNTFGTGQFLLLNTGTECVLSEQGLLSTIGYKMGPEADTHFAVEGAVAISGVGLKWMVESLKFGDSPKDIVNLAESVKSTKGLYFVPAFSGLMAPHWRPDARGIMIGWTHYHGRAHLCRALVEALCFQCRDVVSAMGVKPEIIKVDGGVAQSDFTMQLLADLTEITVERPKIIETTAAGAAIVAGIGVGHWKGIEDLKRDTETTATRFQPNPEAEAEWRHGRWLKAVERCIRWEDHHFGGDYEE